MSGPTEQDKQKARELVMMPTSTSAMLTEQELAIAQALADVRDAERKGNIA